MNNKTEIIKFRISEDLKKQLEELVEIENKKLPYWDYTDNSKYIRNLIREDYKKKVSQGMATKKRSI